MYNIRIEFAVIMKLVKLIKMCLIETYSKDHICKHLLDSFPIQNSLNEGDASSPLLFNYASEHAIRKVQETPVGLKFNGTYFLAYADYVNLMGDNILRKNTENLFDTIKEVDLEVDIGRTKYMLRYRQQNIGQIAT
jgi:hypothetical protein